MKDARMEAVYVTYRYWMSFYIKVIVDL